MSKNLLEALDMLLGLTNGDPEKLKLISMGYKLGRGNFGEIREEEPVPVPPATSKLDPLAMPPSPPSPPSPTIPLTKRKSNRGIRATILRLLTTGPTDYDNLRRSTNIEDRPLKNSILQLLEADMIIANKDGLYSLTARGWPEANFFRANPELKIRPAHPAKKA